MYIKILNKNLQTENDYTSAKTYEIAEGAVFTYTKNETLDSATIVIENQTEKIEMSPYDIVEILNYNGQRFQINNTSGLMCIDTYTETMTCVNPKIYRYEITLFSETKQLEGIILPNLKITKVWNKTRTVYDYINQYMIEYCPRIRIKNGNNIEYDYKFKWDDDLHSLQNKFNMQCPEMQWNTPTLREVLNDLMMVADCIPVLNNGTLSFMDLTEVADTDWTNDTTHINYVTRSKSSEDYVSELQVNLENVTNQTEGVNNLVTKAEWVMFSPTDGGVVLQNDNMILKTSYPIYRLKSLVAHFEGAYVIGADATNTWMTQDITNIVFEYQEWITKKVLYNTNSPSFEHFGESQNWSVYYTRGTNEIRNWNHKTKFWWQDKFLYDELFDKIIRYQHPNVNPGSSVTKPYWYTIFFKIEYETLAGCVFRASKNDNVEHERVVIDNQTNSMVDSYTQGFLEYQKANRLGNEQLQINARINDDTPIQIGDTYDDCVIYQVQHQIFKNHAEINALATKNYILREYFTGVKSKIRSWQIADESQSCKRHDLIKYYCEFSYTYHEEVTSELGGLLDYNIGTYLLSSFNNYNSAPIRYAFVQTRASDTDNSNIWYPLSSRYYCLDLISRLVGNSLVFNYEFYDNFWACQMLDTDVIDEYTDFAVNGEIVSGLIENKGFPLKMRQYTNDIGEYNKISAIFSENIINSPYSGDWVDGEDVRDYPDKAKDYVYNLWQMPEVGEQHISNDKFYSSIEIHKDSQERIAVSTQFEFSTETNNICFSKEFLKRQRAINISNNDTRFYYLLLYNKSVYNFRRPDELPDEFYYVTEESIDSLSVSTTYHGNSVGYVSIRLGTAYDSYNEMKAAYDNMIEKYCFYLTEGDIEWENPKPIIALKDFPLTYTTIDDKYYIVIALYLNVLKTRNKNVYDKNNHYLIVDKI